MSKIWWINKDIPLFKNSGSCIARTEKHWDDDKPHMEVKPCHRCEGDGEVSHPGGGTQPCPNLQCKDGWVIA